MGYKRARTVKLTWADGEFEGLEVRAKRISIGKFLKLLPLLDGDFGDFNAETVKDMEQLVLEFGRYLVSWNLEDEDGQAVPCTPESFMDQDLAFVMEVVQRYGESISGVSAPLPQSSSGGAPSLEASLPMEPLSPSLAS